MVGCDFRDSCSYISLCPKSLQEPASNTDSIGYDHCDIAPCTRGVSEKVQSDNKDLENVIDSQSSSKESSSESDESPGTPLESVDDQQDSSEQSNAASPEDLVDGEKSKSVDNSSNSFSNLTTRAGNLCGAHAHFRSDSKQQEEELHSYQWDIIIGADGRRNTLSKFFPRKEFRGRLAIAITANFINRQTQAETSVPEISGLSFIYNQDLFNALSYDTNIQLENVCYYKDDTHYFVMTAKKSSLLERGVLIQDCAATQDLLSDSNVNKKALLDYARDAAHWTTGLEPLEFALNHHGQEDCAMFDFTSMYAASNACKALRTKGGGFTLVSLVGDSLLEPFWPTGSGCARGFLSSLDAAWMCRQWAVNKCAVLDYHDNANLRPTRKGTIDHRASTKTRDSTKSPSNSLPTTNDRMALSVMAERESIYRILAQTTSDNLQQDYSRWTLSPRTRYPNLNRHLILPSQVEHLLSDGTIKTTLSSQHLKTKAGKIISGNVRRVKSPNSFGSKKSPKKLKSAGASPQSSPRNLKNRSKSLSKFLTTSRNRREHANTDSYLDYDEPYGSLSNSDEECLVEYLNRRKADWAMDDLLLPSISGTLPSSNNLSNLEARRAREIEDCLRQRRQKARISCVRDELVGRIRDHHSSVKDSREFPSNGNAVLFNEIKRLREQSAAQGGEPRSRDVNGPMSVLNSMRRCASFSELVRGFEDKLMGLNINDDQSSFDNGGAMNAKMPIDKVTNLPQFATLQDLIMNGSSNRPNDSRKSHLPVTKLSKDDWNVRCWENKAEKEHSFKVGNGFATMSSQRGKSSSGRHQFRHNSCASTRPDRELEVFHGRIKEIADKLKLSEKAERHDLDGKPAKSESVGVGRNGTTIHDNGRASSNRSQNWINHLKLELVKSSKDLNRNGFSQQQTRSPMGKKPVKKLFEDDDDDDDGLDPDKHYDHLCQNPPAKSRYISRGAYTSHLARVKFHEEAQNAFKKMIPSNQSAQSCVNHFPSTVSPCRGSSPSSTTSEYSGQTRSSSTDGGSNQQSESLMKQQVGAIDGAGGKLSPQPAASIPSSVIDVDCVRCKKFVSSSDRITIGQFGLHRSCLSCAKCGLSLRSDEIQYYLNLKQEAEENELSFLCSICKPDIMSAQTDPTSEEDESGSLEAAIEGEPVNGTNEKQQDIEKKRPNRVPIQRSREEFFNSSKINYNELYKNILRASSETLAT